MINKWIGWYIDSLGRRVVMLIGNRKVGGKMGIYFYIFYDVLKKKILCIMVNKVFSYFKEIMIV